jgi:hypothetical protein
MGAREAAAALAGGLILAGCAMGGGDTPRRPVVSVTDEVQAVDRAAVIGTWECRELNPFPEVPQVTTRTTYRADGSFTSEGRSAPRPPFGSMEIQANGRWAVEDQRIVTSGVETDASSEDAWTNFMAGVSAQLVDSFGGRENRSSGDVLKLTRSELVLRPAGVEDPPVIACTRSG